MTRPAARAVLIAASLAAAPAAWPQTVDEIVARNVAARGGRAALASVKSLRMTGKATAGAGREAIVRREIARPGRIRTEFVFQGTTGVYAWDGTSGWQISPLDGQFDPQPMSDTAAAVSAEQADLDGPLVDWKAKGHEVRLVGTAALAGGKAYELELTPKSGAARRVFVDAASGLVVRTSSLRKVRGHEVVFEVAYGDYRETGGVMFARAIEIGIRDRPERLRIRVENVELNPALEESRFAAPR
jgi:hypothetical protein